MPAKSLLEVQFPIAQISLESYKERTVSHGKILSLGKWWGEKPMVLTRAIIIAALFEASDDPARWPEDLEIFFKLMCLDNAGMWKRKEKSLPAEICHPHAREMEKLLFAGPETWAKRLSAEERASRENLEKRVFYTLGHARQRDFCCRVEEMDGPPQESWVEINAYCGTHASGLREWVTQMSKRRFGRNIRVGDAFSGSGSIPFEAAELGCDVFASDLNPVACSLTWGALNLLGERGVTAAQLESTQEEAYDHVEAWLRKTGYEASEEGWRADVYFYCLEVCVPEWDGWRIPLSPTWQISSKAGAWVELIPDSSRKRFDFKIRTGGPGFAAAHKGTKQATDVVCPDSLWKLLHKQRKTANATPAIAQNVLLSNCGGLRKWESADYQPKANDFFTERLYCIRWRLPDKEEDDATEKRSKFEYREPTPFDLKVEDKVTSALSKTFVQWRSEGIIPDWRIQDGNETSRLGRERGWAFWSNLFNPRQLLTIGRYAEAFKQYSGARRAALILVLGRLADSNAKLCRWDTVAGQGAGSTHKVFFNQALNTLYNYTARSWSSLRDIAQPKRRKCPLSGEAEVSLCDARDVDTVCDIWITDPPYADAVNYEELSEFFLAWYKPHLQACFPEWYADSKRDHAVKGDDAPFRVAMAECYSRLAEKMPDAGLQVLMFTHKDTDVWEDLALIMWAAGLQVKQVWSISTETPGVGIRVGNYVQATYNMVLRKRPKTAPMGFAEMVIPQINSRVKEVITHMRESQVQAGNLSCGYTDTDYLLAAQAVAAEVVTGFSSIDGIDLDEELRTLNKERRQRGASVLRDMMNQAKRTAVDFLVPLGLEEHLKRSPDGTSAYQFWRALAPEEKFLLKALELEAGGVDKIGAFQDLGRAYGIADYEALLGPVKANEARTKLPADFPRPDLTRWDELPATERDQFAHCITRHIYHALQLLGDGAESDRAVKHLVDSTNFWQDRQGKHLVILGYLYQITQPIAAWDDVRPHLQTLRLAVENHRD